ncbi:hypothetical protein BIW11_02700 [Tropilaelaps mercedesae]|uniref:Uncharacterized protein n=1 Tax=Tropilaelaps mercedesae TaxID=418985 RepID=A0A1V9XYV2_9ACAR|nr:hypothetical protein BIW11_02700 [Tropilaelaps mercedesae]
MLPSMAKWNRNQLCIRGKRHLSRTTERLRAVTLVFMNEMNINHV